MKRAVGDQCNLDAYLDSSPQDPKDVDLHPDEGLMVPKSIVMVQDVMHFVTNVLYGFLSFLANEDNAGSSPEEAFLNQYVDVALHGRVTEGFSMYRPDKEILKKAKKRLQSLPLDTLEGIGEDSLTPSRFKAMKCHDCLVMGFALFSFLFQDSMTIPSVFAMKVVIDGLSFVFTSDGAYHDLLLVQAVIDFFLAVLQGEVSPSSVTPSVHNTRHIVSSVICHGCAIDNNCFTQEHMYGFVKKAVATSCNPNKTIQKRLLGCNTAEVYSFCRERDASVDVVLSNPLGEEDWNWIGDRLDWDVYDNMTLSNIELDAEFYHCDSTPCCGALDVVTPYCTSEKKKKLRKVVEKYGRERRKTKEHVKFTRSMSFITKDGASQPETKESCLDVKEMKNKNRIQTILSEVKIGSVRTGSFQPAGKSTVPLESLSQYIGFTRLFNGRVVPFLIVGYTAEMVNGDYPYYQALCVPLKVESGSTFMETQHHSVFLYSSRIPGDISVALDKSLVIPISLNRLVLNKALVTKFDCVDVKYGVSYLKLCIRQFKPIPKSPLFDYIEGDPANRRPVTRSIAPDVSNG